MTRKKARHLLMELSRRIYMRDKGTLKGWGKQARFYMDGWKPEGISKFGGYKGAWENSTILELRKMYGM